MKARRSSSSRSAMVTLPLPMIAVAVGVLCVACIQLSHSATIPEAGSSDNTSAASSKPTRITSLRTAKPRMEVQVTPNGRMKASDIKACISKAFCEVNSASKTPNYAVNQEFFDLMNQIHASSNEDIDSGSNSLEDDDEDEEEDDDDDASSEESSSERRRGYPPPPPGYRRGREMDLTNGTTSEVSVNGTETESSTSSTSTTATPTSTGKTVKKADKKKGKKNKAKKGKTGGRGGPKGQKMVKKFVNGTLVSVPKRRSRIETAEEKAEKKEYLTRKQREMGQVNDLAALIRISADIGLTLRSPRKCRTLFNKCAMTHEQIVDLFNQTLIAVTAPPSSARPSSVPTTKRSKVTTTLAAAITSSSTSTAITDSTSASSVATSPLTTVQEALTPTQHTTTTTILTTQKPSTTTVDDGNRSSKSRHDFSDEDVEYLTDTEIQPVQTYALFVNDAPDDTGKTVEEVEVSVPDTFKKYANAFPIETALPGDIPSLRKRSNKKKNLKGMTGRSSGTSKISKRRRASSEEEDEDEEDEEDDDAASTSAEDEAEAKSGFRIENPYPGYRVNKGGVVDDEKSVESVETNSGAVGKDSNEGILPPLVQKEGHAKPKDEEEDDEDDDSEESAEADEGIRGAGSKRKGSSSKLTKSSNKKKAVSSKRPIHGLEEDESSEEDDVEVADDDQQSPPPWTPVYQMHMSEKKKQGYKKKQKGPYKGGEGHYADDSSHHTPQSSSGSFSSFLKKPWGGSSHSASQEIPGAGSPVGSHESGYPAYEGQHYHGGPPGGPSPYGGSQEVGGSEQKAGFLQSIMSWFTGGNKNNEQGVPHQGETGYGGSPMHTPYGGHGGHGQHGHYGPGSIENDDPAHSATGAPWPSQPDPAGVGHYGQSYKFRGYRKPTVSSEEEDEELVDEPTIISKKNKKNKRRYRGRSDSIITTQPKKSSNSAKKSSGGPPPPVVVIPKDSKSVGPAGTSPVGAYEPNHQYDKLIQADGGITSGSNLGKKVIVSSTKENKRAKKAAVKPSKNQQQQNNKKSQKQSVRAAGHRASRESAEDDDEAYSSEELYNKQVAKMKTNSKTGASSVTLGGSSSSNAGNKPLSDSKQSSDPSFPSYFESMFGTEEKDKYKIKGKDDGSLLYGFDSLSSTLHADPIEQLPVVQGTKKKPSSYKVNKTKKSNKTGGSSLGSQPVKFNNKEVIESSEEDEEKKKKRR